MTAVGEWDRVDVIEFVLPIDHRVVDGKNPTDAAELVADLFNTYIWDAVFTRGEGWSLVPYGSPEPCGWPAHITPDETYLCWRMWFAKVVTEHG